MSGDEVKKNCGICCLEISACGMKQHIQTVHMPEKIFSCSGCGKVFSRKTLARYCEKGHEGIFKKIEETYPEMYNMEQENNFVDVNLELNESDIKVEINDDENDNEGEYVKHEPLSMCDNHHIKVEVKREADIDDDVQEKMDVDDKTDETSIDQSKVFKNITTLSNICRGCKKVFDRLIKHLTGTNLDCKTFYTSDELQMHKEAVLQKSRGKYRNKILKVTPFSCPICGFKARRKYNLKQHVEKKHAINGTSLDQIEETYPEMYNKKRENEFGDISDITLELSESDIKAEINSDDEDVKYDNIPHNLDTMVEVKIEADDDDDGVQEKMDVGDETFTKIRTLNSTCRGCKKVFERLIKHLTGTTLDCKTFYTTEELKIHKQAVFLKGQRKYINKCLKSSLFSCPICGSKIKRKTNLRQHIKNKHAINGTSIAELEETYPEMYTMKQENKVEINDDDEGIGIEKLAQEEVVDIEKMVEEEVEDDWYKVPRSQGLKETLSSLCRGCNKVFNNLLKHLNGRKKEKYCNKYYSKEEIKIHKQAVEQKKQNKYRNKSKNKEIEHNEETVKGCENDQHSEGPVEKTETLYIKSEELNEQEGQRCTLLLRDELAQESSSADDTVANQLIVALKESSKNMHDITDNDEKGYVHLL